jgi:hypothetical protein
VAWSHYLVWTRLGTIYLLMDYPLTLKQLHHLHRGLGDSIHCPRRGQ